MAYSVATRTPTDEAEKKRKKEHSPFYDKAFPQNTTISDPRDSAEKEAAHIASTLRNSQSGAASPEQAESEGSSAHQKRMAPYVSMLGQQLGADFSGVSIHTDEKADTLAQSVDARAFTQGKDIYFAKDEYTPGTDEGKELLAHELAHTIQQGAVAQHGGAVEVQQSAAQGTVMRAGPSKKTPPAPAPATPAPAPATPAQEKHTAAVTGAAQSYKTRFVEAEGIGIKRIEKDLTDAEKAGATKAKANEGKFTGGKTEFMKENWSDMISVATGATDTVNAFTENEHVAALSSGISGMNSLVSGTIDTTGSAKEGNTGHAIAQGTATALDTGAAALDTTAASMNIDNDKKIKGMGENEEEKKKKWEGDKAERSKVLGATSGALSTTSAAINTGVNIYDYQEAGAARQSAQESLATLEEYMANHDTLAKSIPIKREKITKLEKTIERCEEELDKKDPKGDPLLKGPVKEAKERELERAKAEKTRLEEELAPIEKYADKGYLRREIAQKKREVAEQTKARKNAGVGIGTSIADILGGVANIVGAFLPEEAAKWLSFGASLTGGLASLTNIIGKVAVNKSVGNDKTAAVDTLINYEENKEKLVEGTENKIKADGDWAAEYGAEAGDLKQSVVTEAPKRGPKAKAYGESEASTDIGNAIKEITIPEKEVRRIVIQAYGYQSGKEAEVFQTMDKLNQPAPTTP